jgi:long-chain acyl-CoA synthetase
MKDEDRAIWTAADALAALGRAGARPAVMALAGERVVTHTGAELLALARGTAARLSREGVGAGDPVAIRGENSAAWLAAALACWRQGAVLVPVDAAAPREEAARQIAEAGARLVLCEAEEAEALGETAPAIALGDLEPADDAPGPADLSPADPVALFRTSGTTGPPKTFHLSRRNIGVSVDAIVSWDGVTAEDRVMLPLPLHHVYPLLTAAMPALTIGAALVLPEGPTGPQIATAMRETRPSVLIGVPRLFEAMLDGIERRAGEAGRPLLWLFRGLHALAVRLDRAGAGALGRVVMTPFRRMAAPALRLCVAGGAALKPEVADRLRALGWDVRTGYGLSETASAFAGTFEETRRGSVGRPVAGGEVRIETPNEEGVGEILVRGPTVFDGYIDNPEANSGAFDADGYFRTGDLGRVDEDGFLYVTGRTKEVIVLAGGENIYPEDVEEAYLESPRIAEIGVLEKDGSLVALVRPDTAEIAEAGVVDMRQAVSVALASRGQELPPTRRLSGFALIREELPRTRLGKIRRFKLPELYERAKEGNVAEAREPTEEERAWIGEEPRKSAWECLGQEAGERPVGLDSHLQLDLGMDSFAWMTLAVSIEERTGVRLEAPDIAEIDTARDLLETVTEKARAEGGGPGRAEILERDRKWLAPRTWRERALGRLLHALNWLGMRLVFRLSVEGRENLPSDGPVLVCPNHASDLDPPAIAAALPRHARARAVWAADRVAMFRPPIRRRICRPVRVFPVDEAVPEVAVDLALEALGDGAVQVWFPEGWRAPEGRLMPFQAGVGRIVAGADPVVVPAWIDGTFEALPRWRRFPRLAKVRVVFGEGVPAARLREEAGGREGRERDEAIASALRERVRRLGEARGRDIG